MAKKSHTDSSVNKLGSIASILGLLLQPDIFAIFTTIALATISLTWQMWKFLMADVTMAHAFVIIIQIFVIIVLLFALLRFKIVYNPHYKELEKFKELYNNLKNQYDQHVQEKIELEKQCKNLRNEELMTVCKFSEEERKIILTLFEVNINQRSCEDILKLLNKSKECIKHYKRFYNEAENKQEDLKQVLSKHHRIVLIDYAQEDSNTVSTTQQRLENRKICCVDLDDIEQLQNKDYDYNDAIAIIVFYDNTELSWIITRLKKYQRIQAQRTRPIRILVCSSKEKPPQIKKLPKNAIWKEHEDCISEVLKNQ